MFYLFPASIAYAEEAAAQGPGGAVSTIMNIAPIAILIVVFYFLLIRPQQKSMKEHREMLGKLQAGDNVVTRGGVHGRVTAVKEETINVEIAKGVEIKMEKSAVQARKAQD